MLDKNFWHNRPSIPDIGYWNFDKDGRIIIKNQIGDELKWKKES